MPRTPAKFTQADIARALKAADQCDLRVEVILEPDGRIRIVPSDAHTSPQVDEPLDIVL
jgi:hypothetical protein